MSGAVRNIQRPASRTTCTPRPAYWRCNSASAALTSQPCGSLRGDRAPPPSARRRRTAAPRRRAGPRAVKRTSGDSNSRVTTAICSTQFSTSASFGPSLVRLALAQDTAARNGRSWRNSIRPSRTSSSEAENDEARALRRIFGSTPNSISQSSRLDPFGADARSAGPAPRAPARATRPRAASCGQRSAPASAIWRA